MKKHQQLKQTVTDWYARKAGQILGFNLDYWIGENINRDMACYADYIFLSFSDMQIIIDHLDAWVRKYGSRETVGQAVTDWYNYITDKDEDMPEINLWSWLNGLRPEDIKPDTISEMVRLEKQVAVLRKVQEVYSGKTIDNIIIQIESRIRELSKIHDKELAKDMDIKLIPYELAEGMEKTRQLIEGIQPGQTIAIFIGPEGGFDESEVQAAQEAGIEPVTLGRRILRTETAPLAILAWLGYHLEA